MTGSSDLLDFSPPDFVEGRAGRFGFRRGGPRTGPPLILCQRFRGTIDDWDPAFLAPLAAERDVVVFDNLGIGHSSGEVPPTAGQMATDALEFASLIGAGSFDLLGWSMGGFVAQEMTLAAPERVRRLIVAASKPGAVPEAPTPPPEVSAVAGKPVNDEADFLYLFFPDTAAGRAAGVESLSRLVADSPATVSAAGAGAQTQALMAWSAGRDAAWGRVGELTLPVLIGHGAHDILMPSFNAYALATNLPDAKLVLYGDAAHAFLFQHADDFAGEVLRFTQ